MLYENWCLMIDAAPRCILFEREDDPGYFYVQFECFHSNPPIDEFRLSDLLERYPIGYLDSKPLEEVIPILDKILHNLKSNASMKEWPACSCVKRLSPKEVAYLPPDLRFKDILLSEEGLARLKKAQADYPFPVNLDTYNEDPSLAPRSSPVVAPDVDEGISDNSHPAEENTETSDFEEPFFSDEDPFLFDAAYEDPPYLNHIN